MSDAVIVIDDSRIEVDVAGVPGVGTPGAPGPAGDIAKVDTRAALKAVTAPAAFKTRWLAEEGREGIFQWLVGNYSAHVTGDPEEGIYLESDHIAATIGAWARRFSGLAESAWWGTVADYDDDPLTATDDADALDAALATLQVRAFSIEPQPQIYWWQIEGLKLSRGRYWLSRPFSIINGGRLVIDFSEAEITFPEDEFGIVINNYDTDIEAARDGPFPFDTKLIRPRLRGNGGTDRTKHGIWMRRAAVIVDPDVARFSGDGVRIGNSNGHSEGNQNGWCLDNPRVQACGGDGIHAEGGDASAGICTNYNVALCGRFAIVDLSGAGNKWNGQAADCGVLQAGVNTVPAFVFNDGFDWAIIAGQEANTDVEPSDAASAIYIKIGAGSGVDPAIPTWVPDIVMEAGGSLKTIGGGAQVQFDHPYNETGPYSVWQLNSNTVVRDPIGSVTGIGGVIEYATGGRMRSNRAYESVTTSGASTSFAILGGTLSRFLECHDAAGNNWFLTGEGGFFHIQDNQSGTNPLAISTPGSGITFGRGAAVNGVLFSSSFALGYANSGRIFGMSTGAPADGAAGDYGQGEVRFELSPVIGGPAYYVRTTSNVWKPVGNVGNAPSIQTVASAATVTPTFANDQVNITAQAVALDLANPTGTAVDGWGIAIRIKDNGTARAITYGAQYRAIGVTLPATTVISKMLYLGGIWNAADSKFDIVSVAQEA